MESSMPGVQRVRFIASALRRMAACPTQPAAISASADVAAALSARPPAPTAAECPKRPTASSLSMLSSSPPPSAATTVQARSWAPTTPAPAPATLTPQHSQSQEQTRCRHMGQTGATCSSGRLLIHHSAAGSGIACSCRCITCAASSSSGSNWRIAPALTGFHTSSTPARGFGMWSRSQHSPSKTVAAEEKEAAEKVGNPKQDQPQHEGGGGDGDDAAASAAAPSGDDGEMLLDERMQVPDSLELLNHLEAAKAIEAKLRVEVAELTDKLMRSMAEMENVRTRATREVENDKKFGSQGLIKDLLDVPDNLERAAASVPEAALAAAGAGTATGGGEHADPEKLRSLLRGLLEGVRATEKIMLQVLRKQGVEQFNPEGEMFDPNQHSALFQVPDGSKEAGLVAVVSKKGYRMFDRIVRPAEVGVTRAP